MSLRDENGWIRYHTGTLEDDGAYLQVLRDHDLLDGMRPRYQPRRHPGEHYRPRPQGMHAQRDQAAEDLIQAAMASDPDVCADAWQLVAKCRPSFGTLRHAMEIVSVEHRIRGVIAGATLDTARRSAIRAVLRGKTPRGFEIPAACRATLLRPLIDKFRTRHDCELCGSAHSVAGERAHYPGCEALAGAWS